MELAKQRFLGPPGTGATPSALVCSPRWATQSLSWPGRRAHPWSSSKRQDRGQTLTTRHLPKTCHAPRQRRPCYIASIGAIVGRWAGVSQSAESGRMNSHGGRCSE
jgi:hypothetical protein